MLWSGYCRLTDVFVELQDFEFEFEAVECCAKMENMYHSFVEKTTTLVERETTTLVGRLTTKMGSKDIGDKVTVEVPSKT